MAFSNPRDRFYIRLFAFILIGCGLFLALIISKYGSLKCDRYVNQCQFESGSLLRNQREEFAISELKGASIDTQIRIDRYKRVFKSNRVVLLPDRTLLIENYWPGREPQQIADQINNFIKDPQQRSLQVSQDERYVGVPGGIGLVVAGILILSRFRKLKRFDQ